MQDPPYPPFPAPAPPTRLEHGGAVDGESASDSAVPGLGPAPVRHQLGPVGLDVAADVVVPAEKALLLPHLAAHHEVVQCEVDDMDPERREESSRGHTPEVAHP